MTETFILRKLREEVKPRDGYPAETTASIPRSLFRPEHKIFLRGAAARVDSASGDTGQMRLRQYILAGVVGIALLVCGGCIDRSLNPWFPKADVVSESWLLGKWTTHLEDETDTMTFTRGEGNAYRIDYLVERRGSGETDRGFYEGRLGRIDAVYYLDYQPVPLEDRIEATWMVRTHGLARLDYADNKLRIRLLNAGRLEKTAKEGKLTELKFTWMENEWTDNEILLTSSTAELRRFLTAHARGEGFFDPQGGDFVRAK